MIEDIDAREVPNSAPDASPTCDLAEDMQAQLAELQASLEKSVEATQLLVKAHPIASLLSVFAIGLVIGRLAGRR